MKIPEHKQNWEVFEEAIQQKKLIVWGRNKQSAEVCGKYPVTYIVDRNDELCDVSVGGIRIYLPDRLYSENPKDTVILVCVSDIYYQEITAEINEIGSFDLFYYNAMNNSFVNAFSAGLYDGLDDIRRIQGILFDDRSKKVLHEVAARRICGITRGYADLKVADEIQYIFYPALMSKQRGTILDVGGYIGDTIDRFINKSGNTVSKIISFEALQENVDVLMKKKDELTDWSGEIEIFPYAVSD